MAAEANYGGRVTDKWDSRLIKSLLKKFYTPDIFKADYTFSPSGLYKVCPEMPLENYKCFIDETLPLNDRAEIFGLHENAELTSAIKDTNKLLESILNLLPRTSSSASESNESKILKTSKMIAD